MTALIVLGIIALIAAVVLYVCSKRFAVAEDPRIGEVAAVLPQANCEDVVLQVAQDWLQPLLRLPTTVL